MFIERPYIISYIQLRMAKKFIIILFVFALLAGAIAAARYVAQKPVVVRVTRIQPSALNNPISTNGKVEATKVYELHAPFPGVCRNVMVHEGDRLASGQPVLTIEEPALPSELAAARSELDAARAELKNVERGAPPEELNQAEAEISRLNLQLQTAQKNLQTNQWLHERKAIARSELENNQREVEQLQQALAAARTRLQDIRARYGEEDRKRATSRVEAALARIEFLENNRARSIVRAPAAGTLYNFKVRESSYINAGDLISFVADLESLRVRAFVDEPDFGQVIPGSEVNIRWNAYPDLSWKGAIQKIPPEVVRLETRSVAEVLCSIDSPRQGLIPNVNVDVEISSRPGPKVPSLPRSAVFTDGENQYAWVVKDGKAERREVQTGLSTTTRVEVTDGLSQEDQVIIPGDVPIAEGMRVQVAGG
jgi:HlyD family secretion protein